MNDRHASSVDAVLELARRGGLAFRVSDRSLLSGPCPGLRWLGGIRQDGDGHLSLVESVQGLPDADGVRLGQILAAAYVGFYDAGADGLPLADVHLIEEWFGSSVETNYPEASREFLRFARTYWTLKVLIREEEQDLSIASLVCRRLDALIWPLFFPFDGPLVADPKQREADQRGFLAAFAPRIPIEPFVRGNPILIRDKSRYRG